jgi:hypothetical protein
LRGHPELAIRGSLGVILPRERPILGSRIVKVNPRPDSLSTVMRRPLFDRSTGLMPTLLEQLIRPTRPPPRKSAEGAASNGLR